MGAQARGDSIPAKIEEGLERSRVLVLCLSAHAFGSDLGAVGVRHLWEGQLALSRPAEQGAPLHSLWLDDAPIKGSLTQFLYFKWHPPEP